MIRPGIYTSGSGIWEYGAIENRDGVSTVVVVGVCVILLSSLGEYAKHVNSYSGWSFYYISCYAQHDDAITDNAELSDQNRRQMITFHTIRFVYFGFGPKAESYSLRGNR